METNFKGTHKILGYKLFNNRKITPLIMISSESGHITMNYSDWHDKVDEAKENANLIIDAFNVRQQINVDLPELLKQRDELLEVVNELLKDLEFHGYRNSTAIYKANNLITKIEQK